MNHIYLIIEYLCAYFCFCSGFESETDTEEFEKVGQSPIDRQRTDVASLKAMSAAAAVAPYVATASVAANTSQTFCPKPQTTSMSTSTEIVATQEASTLTEVRLITKTTESYSNNMMMTSLTFANCLTASHLSNNDTSLKTTATINPKSITPIPPSISSSQSFDNPSVRFDNIVNVNDNNDSSNNSMNDNNIKSKVSSINNINNNNINNHNNNVNNANTTSTNTTNRRADSSQALSPIPECDSPSSHNNLLDGDCDGDASDASSTTNSIGVCEKFRCSEFQSCHEDGDSEFVNSEFYIDESLPSSMTISDPMPIVQPAQSECNSDFEQDIGGSGGAVATKLDHDDDLQQLIAEIEIFSFDSCQSNDDKILMLLQVLPPSPYLTKTKKKNKTQKEFKTTRFGGNSKMACLHLCFSFVSFIFVVNFIFFLS